VSTAERWAVEHAGRIFTAPAARVGIDREERTAVALVHGNLAGTPGELVAYDTKSGSVDLGLVRTGRCPLLREHLRSLDGLLGQVVDGWVENDVLHCVCRFGPGDEADKIWRWLSDGYPLSISLGARVEHAVPEGEGRIRVTRWRLMELSVVTFGQDSADHIKASRIGDLATAVERAHRGVDDPGRLAARQALRLDRWQAWSLAAAVRLADRFGLDQVEAHGVVAELVDEHCDSLERGVA